MGHATTKLHRRFSHLWSRLRSFGLLSGGRFSLPGGLTFRVHGGLLGFKIGDGFRNQKQGESIVGGFCWRPFRRATFIDRAVPFLLVTGYDASDSESSAFRTAQDWIATKSSAIW
jgi:hypothetical protein